MIYAETEYYGDITKILSSAFYKNHPKIGDLFIYELMYGVSGNIDTLEAQVGIPIKKMDYYSGMVLKDNVYLARKILWDVKKQLGN